MPPLSSPRPHRLRRRDPHAAPGVIGNLSEASDDGDGIARRGIEQLPLHSGDGWLVSVVLDRQGRDFSDREVALFGQVQRVLARLFRRTGLVEQPREAWNGESAAAEPPALSPSLPITWREREVLRWAAAGKTDRDIADILAISHRTVHKHLQRVYSKLGVETRTAAVMRAIAHA
jgi:DNA-binding CsgD family transcriptional regulator